jgi:imidazolonepropionase
MTNQTLDLWRNVRLSPRADPSHVIEGATIVVRDGHIEWFGPESDVPVRYTSAANARRHDLCGRLVTPGLVDCHTHLVYAGNRAEEFALRLEGASYEEIARRGGGIVSTVRATRAATEVELFEQSVRRLDALMAEGVTAIEVKSGYGLDLPTERKMLRVARRLARERPVTVSTTFLGAHALPSEYDGRADAYIDHVCNDMLPVLADEGLVDTVDAFCERIAFTLEQCERVFAAAHRLKLPVKMHAEQLSLMGGAQLAARYRALSADHLEYLDEAGVAAMRDAGTVAVLLPGAFYFIREQQMPPIDLLRRYGVPIAVATDSNPGTSPTTSLLLMLNMGCTLFRLSVAEVLAGVTRHAARAVGHPDVTGEIALGTRADFVAWDVDTLAELAYWSGLDRCALVVRHGAAVIDKRDVRAEPNRAEDNTDVLEGASARPPRQRDRSSPQSES